MMMTVANLKADWRKDCFLKFDSTIPSVAMHNLAGEIVSVAIEISEYKPVC